MLMNDIDTFNELGRRDSQFQPLPGTLYNTMEVDTREEGTSREEDSSSDMFEMPSTFQPPHKPSSSSPTILDYR